jgi:S-formylglutathione hydrolase FrmB
MSPLRGTGLGAALAVLAMALLPAFARAADAPILVSHQQLDPRLEELTFSTPALAAETHVRVLLPSGYDPGGHTRYPVLYLLHGAIDDYKSWTDKGDAEAITAGLPLIVVMPDAGQVGNYTNWFNDGAFGQPEWETFHIGQLLPWIDAHYRTVAKRAGRAVAGLSMGGGGAMAYAALHPDLFVSASAFSGAVDTNNPEVQPVTQASGLSDGSHSPGAIYGLRSTEEIRWRGHNSWDLAENLEGQSLTLRTGNGQPGGPYGDSGDPVEADVHEQSVSLHERLVELGFPHVWDDYGPGSHAWPYWQRDLRETLPDIMRTFAHPPAPPSPFDYRSIDPEYGAFGWHVAVERPALEFSELRDANARGFQLLGSGSATVATAALFARSAPVTATIRTGAGSETKSLTADAAGRVSVPVEIGPGNPYQQYSPEAAQAGTSVYAAKVTLSGRRCSPARTIRLRLRGVRRADVRSVVVVVGGHRRAVLHGPRSVVRVRVTRTRRVVLIVRTRDGRKLRLSRRVTARHCSAG